MASAKPLSSLASSTSTPSRHGLQEPTTIMLIWMGPKVLKASKAPSSSRFATITLLLLYIYLPTTTTTPASPFFILKYREKEAEET